jgi:ATP-dependent helicase HepA
MTDALVDISYDQFRAYAGDDLERWCMLVDCSLTHPMFGPGRITKVSASGADIALHIRFDEPPDNRSHRSFGAIVLKISGGLKAPCLLAEQILGQSLPRRMNRGESRPGDDPETTSQPSQPEPAFEVGQELAVCADLRQRGIVLKPPFWGHAGWEYELFFSAQAKRIYRESDLTTPVAEVSWVRKNELLRNLALLKLRRPLSDNLYALYGSRTQFEVYQFRPAVKFLSSPEQRLLIADEVGLGKTIEAGIIYLELQARLDLNRVLVVCPSGLRRKWQDEMRLRFDEEFDVLDAPALRHFMQQYQQFGGQMRRRAIVSLELLRRPEFADQIEEQHMHFDLVIVDEAHHCRNSTTRSNEIATILSENSDAMLLLTATPLQTGNEDLFNLLRILSPGEFDNLLVFMERLQPNEHVNRAAQILATGKHKAALTELLRVEETAQHRRFTGNPYYREVIQSLQKTFLTPVELVACQRRLVELNTLANIFTRTRKREIAEKVPMRAAFTLAVEFTPAEADFYNHMVKQVRDEFARLYGSNHVVGWVSIMRERQVASCIAAARKRFGSLVAGTRLDADEQSHLDTTIVGEWEEESLPDAPLPRLGHNGNAAKRPGNTEQDTKFSVFWRTLEEILAEDQTSKVIVFSYFRGTVEYLYEQLRSRRVGVLYLHGEIKALDRPAVIDQFRSDGNVRVLISSDVGAEGLDFQFCNTIFNYDLPWNPMKVEQRIGRIDRFGQQSPKVRIYNLVIANSIESRILMRLYERIGLFERAVGDIEAILGEEVRELSRKVYTAFLTPTEESRLAEQASQNIIRRQQEMEEFEKQRLAFMGQEAIFSTIVNQTIEAGNYLSAIELQGLVETFLEAEFPRSELQMNQPVDGSFCLDADRALSEYLRGYALRQKQYDKAQEFLNSLDSGKLTPLTFTSKMALERKLLHFITSRHPLTQAAAAYWRERLDPTNSMAFIGLENDDVPEGDYYFFIFELEARGVERSMRLVPVAIVAHNGDVHTELSQKLLRLIQTGATNPAGPLPRLDVAQMAEAEEMAKVYMALRRDELEEEIQRSNTALVNARLEALRQSYMAKRRRVQEAEDKATDKRIQRMRKGQLRNMQAQFRQKKAEIQSLQTVSVSYSVGLRGFVKVFRSHTAVPKHQTSPE